MVKEVYEAITEISRYCSSFDAKKSTIEEIQEVEKKLGLRIADDYKTYLMQCPCVIWWWYEFYRLYDLCKNTLFLRENIYDEISPLPENLYVIRSLTDEGDDLLQDENGAIYLIGMVSAPIKVYNSLTEYIYKEGIPESMIEFRDRIYEENPVNGRVDYKEMDKCIREDKIWLENNLGIKHIDLLCSDEFNEYIKDKEISVRECIENYIELMGEETLRERFPAKKRSPYIPMSAYEDTRWFAKFVGGDFWKFISAEKFRNFINDSHENIRYAMKDYILVNGIEKAKELAGIKQQKWFEKLMSGFVRKESKMERYLTNRELMECGYAPFNRDGVKIELHQLGHMPGAPIAELTKAEYRKLGPVSDEILNTEIDRKGLARLKRRYWKARVR